MESRPKLTGGLAIGNPKLLGFEICAIKAA